jgi:3-hydroxyacyl-[acyl-carrier-protein] dehydratase
MAISLPKTAQEVMHWLPHRPPMLLIDSVTRLEDDSLCAVRHFPASELFFQGHFPPPEGPILPGVIVLEALAQAAALYTALSENLPNRRAQYRFSKVEDVVWSGPVLPGQTLDLSVEKLKKKLGFYQFAGQAQVRGGGVVCVAKFTAKVVEI